MKRLFFLIGLVSLMFCSFAQDAARTMKPNYRKIARVVASQNSPYFLDSLQSRYERLDTSLTVDDLRCLYYGGRNMSVSDTWQRYMLLVGRWGQNSRQAGDAWIRYQWLTSAVWSTGDGSRRRPLHVGSVEDAKQVALGYDEVMWFKIKGKRKFSVVPQQ